VFVCYVHDKLNDIDLIENDSVSIKRIILGVDTFFMMRLNVIQMYTLILINQ
jgi:hypothetical protein